MELRSIIQLVEVLDTEVRKHENTEVRAQRFRLENMLKDLHHAEYKQRKAEHEKQTTI